MNDMLIYRPHKCHIWFSLFSGIIGIFSFIMLGLYIPTKEYTIIFWSAMGVLGVCLTKVLYDGSRIVTFFDADGLLIIDSRGDNCKYFSWGEFSYRYYTRNYKGFLFLVLSPKELGVKDVKSLVNRGANASKVCIDSVVIFYVDDSQNATRLKEYVDKYVAHSTGSTGDGTVCSENNS